MNTLKRLKEEVHIGKTSTGGKLKVTVQNTKLSGNKHGYLSVTGEHTEKGRKKPSEFGTLHDRIKQEHPDGKYNLAMRYHLHTIAPSSAEHGQPLHMRANAYYHGGIGTSANSHHLASHLDISHEHAKSIIDSIKHLSNDEAKKKVIDAHIDAQLPRYKENMNTIMKQHNLEA